MQTVQDAVPRSRRRGVLVGLAVLAVVALPAGYSAFLAMVSFSGCFIECGTPEPAVGALWAAAAVLLLASPLVAGVIAARRRLRLGWVLASVLATAGCWALLRSVV